ncbi:MAG: hypothetical protein AABX61_02690 [Nanoarchaeota archaeon]
MKINIVNLIPKDWLIKDLGNNIEVTYNLKRGNYNRKPFILPKGINIDKKFFEGLGLFLGDSDLNRKEKNHLTYTSIDKDIAKQALYFLRYYFLVKLKDITFLVNYRKENNKLKSEWSNYLKVPTNKILIRYSKRHNNESLQIQVNGVVFRKLFEIIIKKVLSKNILENPDLRRALLRSLFAAEGNIGIDYKENYISQICFSLNIKEDYLIKLIQKALELENIRNRLGIYKKHNNVQIIISNWSNYWKLWKINLFDICERKKESFFNIMKNLNVYLRLGSDFRKKFFNSLNLNQKEIANIIGSWQSNVSKTIVGVHLLRIEQFLKLLKYSSYRINDIIKNTEEIRISSLTKFEPDYEMLSYFFKIKLF